MNNNIEIEDVFQKIQNNFFVKKYKVVCEFITTTKLPLFLGKFLRGSFGRNLKRISCLNKKEKNCLECCFKNICIYFITFESIDEKGLNTILKKGKYLPHPFIIEPPETNKNIYERGECFEFNLILIGFLNYQINLYIKTLISMGEYGIGIDKNQGCFDIKSIITCDNKVLYPFPEIYKIYEFLENDLLKEKVENYNIRELKINFITNTRILNNGKLVGTKEPLEFEILFKSMLNRIKILAYLYNNWIIDLDEKKYKTLSEKIKIKNSNISWGVDWNIYSGRQKMNINLGGIIGDINYIGNLSYFLPFIITSKYIHIGDHTSYGFGKIIFSVIM